MPAIPILAGKPTANAELPKPTIHFTQFPTADAHAGHHPHEIFSVHLIKSCDSPRDCLARA
jgi:hypothetical protein